MTYAKGTAAHEAWSAGYDLYPSPLPASASEYMANGWDDAHDDWNDAMDHRHGEDDGYSESFDDFDDNLTDVEADAMTLTSIGWGTDEDYGYYGDDY